MATIIDRGLAGPDNPIYKGGLKVSSVLGPSALTKNSPKSTAGEKPASAPSDPMLPAMDGMEAAMLEQAKKFGGMGQQPQAPSPSKASTTPSKSEPA